MRTNNAMGPLPAVPPCSCHLCVPDVHGTAHDDRSCVDVVDRCGWQVIVVGADGACSCCDRPAAGGSTGPAFAYTVGLVHRAGHPELAMTGLPGPIMHAALNYVAARVVDGHRVRPGDAIEGALGNVPLTVDVVTDLALYDVGVGAYSRWFHRQPVDVLQLVWPTTGGIFPWQPGCPPDLDELQPPVWRVPSPRVGGLAVDPDWPLPVPPDARAITCVHVREQGVPVLLVARLPAVEGCDEDWQFDCGRDHGDGIDELMSEHVAHAVRSSPSVRQLADLQVGHFAERADPFSPWIRRVNHSYS